MKDEPMVVDILIFHRCGHCKRLAPVWERLAEVTHSSSHATIAKVVNLLCGCGLNIMGVV